QAEDGIRGLIVTGVQTCAFRSSAAAAATCSPPPPEPVHISSPPKPLSSGSSSTRSKTGPVAGNYSASSPRSLTTRSHPHSTSPPPTTNAGKLNCLSTKLKPTKQATTGCCAPAPQN